jgi:hypothetical protein
MSEEVATAEMRIGGQVAREWVKGSDDRWTAKNPQPEDPLDRLLEEERSFPDAEEVAFSLRRHHDELGQHLRSQKQTALSKPFDRGNVVEWGGRSYQRCIPMAPCVPIVSMRWMGVEFMFDRSCQVLFEFVSVQMEQRELLCQESLTWAMRGSRKVTRPDGDIWRIWDGIAGPVFLSNRTDSQQRLETWLSTQDTDFHRKLKRR